MTTTRKTEVPAAEVQPVAGLYLALALVRATLPTVMTDSSNPAFKSKYASLGAVQDAIRKPCADAGILPLFSLRSDVLEDGRQQVFVGLSLMHIETGESVASELGMVPAKQDPQGVGSAITYARRYLLVTMFDLTVDDDDGNTASRPTPLPQRTVTQAAPAQQGQSSLITATRRMHMLGTRLYGSQDAWDAKRPNLVLHFTDGKSSSSVDMSIEQVTAMTNAIAAECAKNGLSTD